MNANHGDTLRASALLAVRHLVTAYVSLRDAATVRTHDGRVVNQPLLRERYFQTRAVAHVALLNCPGQRVEGYSGAGEYVLRNGAIEWDEYTNLETAGVAA